MIELTQENYEKEVIQSELPVLVDFWGIRCARCMTLMPAVEKLAGEYDGKVKFGKVDCPKNRRLIVSLQGEVQTLPTFLFYRDGEIVDKLVGDDVTEADIIASLEKL
ncbi:thioredoxin domain-containing protein [Dehalococcoidia bacterium]|nr:thioredoxin domain-containing protein [Dehalococcoidia bacterium]MCL0058139.1 thioredoxin domain-containing protein [Dehalococcoidia bacterium]MCL0078572.1 thioredoxin domain-containing protein [Dehalococcoidia bacterium]